MKGPISEVTLMEAKATLLLNSGKDIPAKQVELSLFCTTNPKKIPLDFIEGFSDFARNFYVTHDLSRLSTESILGKNSPSKHVKELGFPPFQPSAHVVNYKLEVTVLRLFN